MTGNAVITAAPWPDPPLQPPGSQECEGYATAYVARLFGHDVAPRDVLAWKERCRRTTFEYLYHVLGLTAAWNFWGMPHRDNAIAYGHRPGFREWVTAYGLHGCVGLAVIHLIPAYGHAVVVLEADESGVLLADSVRGLVRDSWERFMVPFPDRYPTRIEAWYRLRGYEP